MNNDLSLQMHAKEEASRLTIGELKKRLSNYPDDWQITFCYSFTPNYS
jgi:hypothetical protein